MNTHVTRNRTQEGKDVKVECRSADYPRVAAQFGIMDDTKAGVPRTGINNVVIFRYRGRRVFLVIT